MEVRMKNVKLSSSCCQAVIKLLSNTKIQKYKNTQNNSPAPAINTQKEKKSKKIKKMQKDKKKCKNTKREKHAKRATKYKILLSRQLLVLRTC